jgi:CRP-like cAMP-binding protein
MSAQTTETGFNSQIYQANQVIFEEGDPANCAFMIRSGTVQIVKRTPSENVVLTTLTAGQAFGELALIDRSPRSATAIAGETTELAVVSAAKFQAKMDALDPFMQAWVQFLKHRILDLSSRVVE